MIAIENRNTSREELRHKYPNALFVDVTFFSPNVESWKLSPYYIHGDIPVPNSSGYYATSVAAIWEGLKVFENRGIDISVFERTILAEVKRTNADNGEFIGHQFGVYGQRIMDIREAREKILIPAYRSVLDYKAQEIIQWIRAYNKKNCLVLLDNSVNCNIDDISTQLSIAFLVKAYVEGTYPYEDVYETVRIHKYYVGRHDYEWYEPEKRLKHIKPFEKEKQLSFDFDGVLTKR